MKYTIDIPGICRLIDDCGGPKKFATASGLSYQVVRNWHSHRRGIAPQHRAIFRAAFGQGMAEKDAAIAANIRRIIDDS